MVYTFYIGGYTFAGGEGAYRAELAEDGTLSVLDAAAAASPTYLIFSADKKYIFAANEARDVDGAPGGAVTAFAVADDGSLAKIVSRSTGGGQPCHLLEHCGYIYAANYGAGSVSAFPLEDGVPGELAFTHQHVGSGPDARRQEGPHAHCAMGVPGADVFCVIDLGLDQARFYRREDKSLSLVQALQFPGGAGPRHVVFTPDGRYGWVVTELSNEIFAIRRKYDCEARDGVGVSANCDPEYEIIAKYSTLPNGFEGRSACAAIRLSADGMLLAVSNRGHDSAAVFEADAETGLLALKGIYPLGGAHPRDINFSPDGRWLLSANQDSDSVTVLSVEDGFRIVDGAALSVPKPACILF